ARRVDRHEVAGAEWIPKEIAVAAGRLARGGRHVLDVPPTGGGVVGRRGGIVRLGFRRQGTARQRRGARVLEVNSQFVVADGRQGAAGHIVGVGRRDRPTVNERVEAGPAVVIGGNQNRRRSWPSIKPEVGVGERAALGGA